MKVRISYSVDVSDEQRRAINQYYGQAGLATRDDVRQWFREYGESMNADLFVADGAGDPE